MEITEYSVEKLKDPFNILTGNRYEFFLEINVPEDDELYSENGVYLRVLYTVDEDRSELVKYELFEHGSDEYLDFELEEEEVEMAAAFCKDHLGEAE